MRWLISQKLEQRIAFEELLEGIRQESERMERLEDTIREVVPEWLSRPCRQSGGLISLRLWGCWPRLVISPAFKICAS